jgi:hypothetical protein
LVFNVIHPLLIAFDFLQLHPILHINCLANHTDLFQILVYTNSLLATLNAREAIKMGGGGIQTVTEDLSLSALPKNNSLSNKVNHFLLNIPFVCFFSPSFWTDKFPFFFFILIRMERVLQSGLILLKILPPILVRNSIWILKNPRQVSHQHHYRPFTNIFLNRVAIYPKFHSTLL